MNKAGRRFTLLTLLLCSIHSAGAAEEFRLSTFSVDVTPPEGHILFTGRWKRSTGVTSSLDARGWVLVPQSGEKPIVFCAVDWAEIRNDAYDRWREVLARSAGTDPIRVFVSSVHQHDTPLADLEAERILRRANSSHQVIDLDFHEQCVQRVGTALKEALANTQPVTYLGLGKASVEKIASNRRYLDQEGKVHYNRMSASRILRAQLADVGDIDPSLRSISFWNGGQLLCVLSVYATHPMSYYGTGKVDAGFPGMARSRRQGDTPEALQIYASGCSGNVTAGKFNDGRPENREILADRLYRGMREAFQQSSKTPLRSLHFQSGNLRLYPRTSPEFSRDHLEMILAEKDDPRSHGMAALGLSWLNRAENPDYRIDVPLLSFNEGEANILLLPAEIYVEYQLFAQQMAGNRFIATIGYGECAPGYIPIDRAWAENDSNLRDWCWIAKGMQPRVEKVIRSLLED